MSQTVRGVVSMKTGSPVELVDIVVPDPGPGEVLVDVAACAVCHTDQTSSTAPVTRPPVRKHSTDNTTERAPVSTAEAGPDVPPRQSVREPPYPHTPGQFAWIEA